MAKAEDPISLAVRNLRKIYGESQEAFAKRIGVGLRTMVRYETGRPPTGFLLGKLSRLAREKNREDLANQFIAVFTDNYVRPGLQPRTEEEVVWTAALLEVLRYINSSQPVRIESVVSEIQDKLAYCLRKIFGAAQRPGASRQEDFERLHMEVRDCAEQLSRRGMARRVSDQLYKLFDRIGAENEKPFEDLWNCAFLEYERDSLYLLSKVEFIVNQALLGPDSRDAVGIREAVSIIDEHFSKREAHGWPELKTSIKNFFGLDNEGE